MSPVSNGLRDRTKPTPIEMRNLYTALNNTEALNNENDHIMATIRLHGPTRQITINAMIGSGATEHFINKGFCSKYNIRITQAKTIREVYLADGRPSAMGPITHTAKVPIDIGGHRELAIFQVAKLPNHEVILGMPWLKQHSPRIGWGQGKITFESERCTTCCLKESPTVYAIPEDEAREANLKGEFGVGQSKKDQRVKVKKLDRQARIPTPGSAQAAGHDLYANESKTIPARGQEVVRTGISITAPRGTYGRIAPRSGMAVKHQIAVNAGVIDSDYTGEIKVVLANRGQPRLSGQKRRSDSTTHQGKNSRKRLLRGLNAQKNQHRTTRIWKHTDFQGTDLRDQCQSLRKVLPKTGHNHRNPEVQQKRGTHKPRISQHYHRTSDQKRKISKATQTRRNGASRIS